MKTINFLSQSLKLAKQIGTPANISVGTFKIDCTGSLHFWAGRQGTFDNYSLKFQLQFRPDHIQMLINLGVKINLKSAKMSGLSEKALRFKSGRDAIKQGKYAPYYYMGNPDNNVTGMIDNWLLADASCNIETLEKLNAICRDNHLHHIAIHNDTVLRAAGFLNEKTLTEIDTNGVSAHRVRVEMIHKQVRKLQNKHPKTNYQIRCERKYNF